jgi:hypothetical protein
MLSAHSSAKKVEQHVIAMSEEVNRIKDPLVILMQVRLVVLLCCGVAHLVIIRLYLSHFRQRT